MSENNHSQAPANNQLPPHKALKLFTDAILIYTVLLMAGRQLAGGLLVLFGLQNEAAAILIMTCIIVATILSFLYLTIKRGVYLVKQAKIGSSLIWGIALLIPTIHFFAGFYIYYKYELWMKQQPVE